MKEATSTQDKTNSFPDALVLELHLRLPPKSVCRFKSVSTSWNNQILDPYFQNMYDNQSKKRPNLIFCKSTPRSRANPVDEGRTEWSSLNTKTLSLSKSFTTNGNVLNKMITCQGMAGFLDMKGNGDETKVHLYCLVTKKLLTLPTDQSSNFTKGPIVGYGIGYLPTIQKYKVYLLFLKSSELSQPFPHFNCQVIEISNSNSNGSRNYSNWRIVEEEVHDLVDSFLPPVFVDNTINWKAWRNDHIVSFDLQNETFQRLNYPNGDNFCVTDNFCLVDLQGKLGLSVTSTSQQPCFRMVIWKLQDSVNHIWEKTYTISPAGEPIPKCIKPIRPIYFHDDEVMIMYSTGCLMLYNLEKHTYKILNVNVSFQHSLVGIYYDSLHYS